MKILATFVFISGINNTGDKLFAGVNDTGDETVAKTSACLHLKMNTKKNQYMNVNNNLTASQQNKKNFLSEMFPIYRRCRCHRWSTLTFEYYREFS